MTGTCTTCHYSPCADWCSAHSEHAADRRRTSGTYGRRWRDPRLEPMGRGRVAVIVICVLLVAFGLLGLGGAFDGWLR